MKIWKVQKGETFAKRQDKVMEWYLIQEGAVAQKLAFEKIILERNSVVGILANEWFLCEYEAIEDTTLIVIPCKNAEELQAILAGHPDYRAVFLRAALEQKYKVLCLYNELQQRSALLHSFAEGAYNDYKALCQELFIEEQKFPRMESFEPLAMEHRAEKWEIDSTNILMKQHLKEYLLLMIKDESLCVGAIMESSAQVRRVTQGIAEMGNYLTYNKDILWSKSENDLFHLFFDIAVQQAKKKKDIAPIQKEMERGYEVMKKLSVFTEKELAACQNKYKNYDYESASKGRVNVAAEDCVRVILNYAGYDADGIQETKDLLCDYWRLPDRQSTDSDVFAMRKKISRMFYDVYEKAFLRSAAEGGTKNPILVMFFNYGFMDSQMLEEETIDTLYNLTEHLKMFRSENVYTMYEWLMAIYRGEKNPSQNEFDQDYNGYLLEERKSGNLTEKEVEEYKQDTKRKVEFEIKNMFQSAHRITYGRISTFCPVICEDEFIQSAERMALTVERLMQSLNNVREVDYSVFYREVMFSDPEHGIPQEWIQKEVLPDMILMPCCGTKGSMWQETSGVKTDTPARFMFPMFFGGDLDELMVELMGRYRWEICRRIQGVYWNDIRERSLTAEYCDYLQFYRKNTELSGDVKEKLKKTLQRCRNSYREVFVKDYQNWMKYEAKGSFRLNKVARNVLIQYCPFSKSIRQSLKSNPVYQNAFVKLDNENKKKEARLSALYEKYEVSGGTVGPDLKENLRFLEM